MEIKYFVFTALPLFLGKYAGIRFQDSGTVKIEGKHTRREVAKRVPCVNLDSYSRWHKITTSVVNWCQGPKYRSTLFYAISIIPVH